MMRSIRRLPALLALPLFATLSLPVRAVESCVGSVAQFDAAVASARQGLPVRILLQRGTYHVGASDFLGDVDTGPLALEGGYDPECNARTVEAGNTIIDGDGAGDAQRLRVRGDVTLDGLRFRNFGANGQPSRLFIEHDAGTGQNTTVRASRFDSMGFRERRVAAGSATTRIVDSLVSGATDGLILDYSTDEPGSTALDSVTTVLVNDTVAGNSGRGIHITSAGTTTIANTIAWANADRDIFLDKGDGARTTADALFLDDTYSTIQGREKTGSFGTLRSDPQFVAADDFHLQDTSPSVDSGTSKVPGSLAYASLDGRARVIGRGPDRGAYESVVNGTPPFILTVTNTDDSGPGSLRQVITDANADPDVNIITFDIPGSCPQTINVPSNLPSITGGVLINGFTQPGTVANTSLHTDNATRCVILNSTGATLGFLFNGTASSQFILRAVAMGGFVSAVVLNGGAQNAVEASQFGGLVAPGMTLAANGTNIALLAGTNATIGGSDVSQRNVIGGGTNFGVTVSSPGNLISGNLIGVTPDGDHAIPNGVGVFITTANNTVDGNVISGNTGDGVRIAGTNATGDVISNNLIGPKSGVISCGVPPAPACTPMDFALGNGRHGVRIEGGANHARLNMNTIALSGVMGISVATGLGNSFFANSIHDSVSYGIDLENVGLNDNDSLVSAQSLPNRGLNFPVITRAYGGVHHGWVEGELDSINDNYVLQVFSSTHGSHTGYGEGETYVGVGGGPITNQPVGLNGSLHFRIPFASTAQSLSTRAISMLARDAEDNTSEFSPFLVYNCDVIFSDGLEGTPSEACPVAQ